MSNNLTNKEKVISLYNFIKELNLSKQKVVLNIKDYPWSLALDDIPQDEDNIKVYYRDRELEDTLDDNKQLLTVHKPEFEKCPDPDIIFINWLESGWEKYDNEIIIKSTIDKFDNSNNFDIDDKRDITLEDTGVIDNFYNKDESKNKNESNSGNNIVSEKNIDNNSVECFEDNPKRVKAFEKWNEKRKKWAIQQKRIANTRDFFNNLYQLKIDLERDKDTLELVVGNGFILDSENQEINHPVITRRVKINYNIADNNISIEDTDSASELYISMLSEIDYIRKESLNIFIDEVVKNDYHPLDRIDTIDFLKRFIRQLAPDSIFITDTNSKNFEFAPIAMQVKPCFICRKRMDKTVRIIEQIIENIEKTDFIPNPIIDIVSGGKIDVDSIEKDESIEEQLASVGGESVDILLSKEANKEQLEIAKRLEKFNAVIVQGPPGTGKTHTIANLVGNILAKGNSVLITSHTQKALNVLKDKLESGIRDLGVSVLDDSNEDMVKSIDGITTYMADNTSFDLQKQISKISLERKNIIEELADVRKKIFAIINKERESIFYNGESYSPSQVAYFIAENEERLGNIIPGRIFSNNLPLNLDELTELYQTNESINSNDEFELSCDLPNPSELIPPEIFEKLKSSIEEANTNIDIIKQKSQINIISSLEENQITFEIGKKSFTINKPKEEHFIKLKELISKIKDKDSWLNAVIADGKRKGSYEENWRKLINQIKETCFIAEKLNGLRFGKTIDIKKDNFVDYKESYEKLKNNNGKVGFFTCFFDKKIKEAIGTVLIDGHQPQSVEDYDLILYEISLRESRKKCASYWNELVFKNTGPNFETFNLNGQPEIIAEKYIKDIEFCLKWYEKEFEEINREIISAGIDKEVLFDINYEITLKEEIRIILDSLKTKAIYICEIVLLFLKQINNYSIINNIKVLLTQGKRSKSKYCNNIIKALNNYNVGSYEFDYNNLVVTYKKQNVIITRNKLLNKLIPVAPDLSKQIDKKIGIHGKGSIPDNFFDAWKWKVLSKELEKIKSESLETLLVKNLDLSKEYRKATAIFAEKSAWYYLLKNTEYDRDMRQALQGWKQTVKKIGKGTGKNAAKYREEARNLMAKCQKAVPAWIMPMNKVIENLDPRINQFDYIIIDEASQADISSLAVLYMGKKLIIVGDDKQVSPLSIGTKTDKINSYEEMYLKDKIPNAHLYNEKTSIYDIASTTFQPLMLREHFRCVPEIIGYSNMLSYDYKIKPLRDGSFSKLIPAVINYRVENGERDGFKTNSKEAQTIVSLIQACMEQPEYKDKTFGVISLLGDEQYKMIQAIIYKNIEQKDISERKILCGNASHFQGDERDVIFLSLVDSRNEEGGPLRKIEFGNDDCIRKRYNVAASRAKDQLWVVHSLDVNNDLKSGDIRKNLIKYAINPKSFENKQEEIKSKSDSEFERLVVSDLDVRGYHLKQQWKVGAYSIDIVAICGENKIAIECDGERWHSGEAKIREDMERQTILERIGWRFIRIRGSEYFRYPDKTINRVVKELNDFGIFPEELNTIKTDEARTSDLLHRVKIRASEILLGFQNTNDSDSAY